MATSSEARLCKIVSVSLGSSRRDHKVQCVLDDQAFQIERVGTDGSFHKAKALLRELDGKVDAIGLGGIDLYVYAGKRRYVIKDALKLKRCAAKTPVVDGSGLKHTLEKRVIDTLAREGILTSKSKVLLVSAVDRWGMAERLAFHRCEVVYGDLLYGLGLPFPIRKLHTVKLLAYVLLPVVTRLPFSWIYPTGKRQEERKLKFPKYFRWADVIAGDFHLIRRHLPEDMSSKVIITNTVTREDIELLKKVGIKTLVTTTPEMQGRSFGTNVLEALLVAALKKKPEEISEQDYFQAFDRLQLQFRIEKLWAFREQGQG